MPHPTNILNKVVLDKVRRRKITAIAGEHCDDCADAEDEGGE